MDTENALHVEDTNQQSLSSKMQVYDHRYSSAIRKGYIKDDYAEQFSSFKGNRDIIMHRGYWSRVYIVKKIIQRFLNTSQQLPIQIFSFGCGLETLWFNLMENQKYAKKQIKFIQLDLHNVVKKKIRKIQKSQKIKQLSVQIGTHDNHKILQDHSYLNFGDKYMLRACDLSQLSQFKSVLNQLKIDYNTPTLFYCQCVLSYIQSDPVDELIKYIHDHFRLCWFFDYEMFNPLDRFGKMMVQNFDARGCHLVGILKYPLLDDQRRRFQNAGFQGKNVQLDTMGKIYYNYIDKNERVKIQKIEMLDELEEWNIIMGHYFGLLAHSCLKLSSNQKNSQIQKVMIQSVKMQEQ